VTAATIDLALQVKQGEALLTEANEILYGGAAGGGKSHLIRVALILWCTEIAGFQAYLFRRLSPDLKKNHIEGPHGFRAMLAPWMVGKKPFVEIVEDEIRFWNGSKIYLCHYQHEKDSTKYQGAEIHGLGIDEGTHFLESQYQFLRSRLRVPGLRIPEKYPKGYFPRVIMGSNPGGVGHDWVKTGFVDNDPLGENKIRQMPVSDGGMRRTYIRARLEDNPAMMRDDPTYGDRLSGLEDNLARMMRDGDWNVIAGAYFSKFSAVHLLSPFDIPRDWTRYRGFDWGAARPFSVGWYAVVGEGHFLPRGALIKYREWYGKSKNNVGLDMTNEDIAKGIVERSQGEEYARSVADPSIFPKSGSLIKNGGPAISEVFRTHGVSFSRGDNDRIAGWTQFKNRLVGEDGNPMIYFFTTCTDSIRTIPIQQYDLHKLEDLDTSLEDHAVDECRYVLMARPYVKPVDKNAKHRPQNVPNMNITDSWNDTPVSNTSRI
jgi:hypothetical protein